MSTRMPPPTHLFCGSSKARQEIGLPGHCERCAEFGHAKAHRNLGCGDVGCNLTHGTCRWCRQDITLLGGSWTDPDGAICCYLNNTSAAYAPHQLEEDCLDGWPATYPTDDEG